MKKILVTGGSGYQGVKLIKKLIAAKYKVINIDNNLFGNYFIKHRNVKKTKLLWSIQVHLQTQSN